jgi:two-component system, NarL family, nitrate/nitrite response regulator NarL
MLSDLEHRRDTIRVLVADSSHIHTHLLADALKRDPLLEAIPFDADSGSLVAAGKSLHIDVLVISATLEEQPSRGFEVLRELRGVCPGIRTVVLLDSIKDDAVLNAFRAGARGIFGKSQPADVLSKCVRSVYQGQIWANSRELAVAVEALASAPALRAVNASGMSLLSKRELQVVRCLAEGLTNREIAERLKLSQHTVKNYLFRVFDKLGVSSRVELLFMTLSQSGSSPAPTPDGAKGSDHSGLHDEFVILQKAAEAGLPAAQLALSQLYLVRRKDPEDVVQAYMWYLIALERASQGGRHITELLTAEQIDEAREKASDWLFRLKEISPATWEGAPRTPSSTRAVSKTQKQINDYRGK